MRRRDFIGLLAAAARAPVPAAALAAVGATRTIPIVMGIAASPVEARLAASLAQPGGNVTGLMLGANELNGKRLELIKQAFPAVTYVAVLVNTRNSATLTYLASVGDAGKALGEHLTIVAVTRPADLGRLGPATSSAPPRSPSCPTR